MTETTLTLLHLINSLFLSFTLSETIVAHKPLSSPLSYAWACVYISTFFHPYSFPVFALLTLLTSNKLVYLLSPLSALLLFSSSFTVNFPLLLCLTPFSFLSLCFFDVKRTNPDISLRKLIQAVLSVLIYTGPLLVTAAIALSVLFLILVYLMEKVGADPRVLDTVIFYGIFYGPFVALYWELKRKCLQLDSLPVSIHE